jgi:hypothetical protein
MMKKELFMIDMVKKMLNKDNKDIHNIIRKISILMIFLECFLDLALSFKAECMVCVEDFLIEEEEMSSIIIVTLIIISHVVNVLDLKK